MDKDNVIKGLEDIQKHLDTGYSFAISWKNELIRDALALLKEQDDEIYALRVDLASANELAEGYAELLKEQEAKPVEVCGQMFTIKYGHCPKCGKGMDSEAYPHWCGFCGQAVKWE